MAKEQNVEGAQRRFDMYHLLGVLNLFDLFGVSPAYSH